MSFDRWWTCCWANIPGPAGATLVSKPTSDYPGAIPPNYGGYVDPDGVAFPYQYNIAVKHKLMVIVKCNGSIDNTGNMDVGVAHWNWKTAKKKKEDPKVTEASKTVVVDFQ